MDAGRLALAPSRSEREVCGSCGVGDAGVVGERVTYGNRLSRGRTGGV